jgi:hypothetical protein
MTGFRRPYLIKAAIFGAVVVVRGSWRVKRYTCSGVGAKGTRIRSRQQTFYT